MLTFSKLGDYGNLGNQLHQLASLIGFSEKYGCKLVIPQWKYAFYFEEVPEQNKVQADIIIKEQDFHFMPEYWDQYKTEYKEKIVDLLGYLQSEKYWAHCTNKVLKALSFKDSFIRQTQRKFSAAFKKPTIAISIRRGDFAAKPGYVLLPLAYYLRALLKYFPNYKDYNIIIFSDDLIYCKAHIRNLKNIFFSKGLIDIEQLCLMSQCDHFIISNSTFSWWGARLGEKPGSKIIRSAYQFTGWLSKMNTKDYYPERWFIYDHINKECELKRLLHSERIAQWRLLLLDSTKFENASRKLVKKLLGKKRMFLFRSKSYLK